jgi:hypothetical protein
MRATNFRPTTAPRRAHEQQIGDVGAGDEQHEADRAEQGQQRRAHVARDEILKLSHGRRVTRVEVGPLGGELLLNPFEFGPRLLDRHAVFQPRDDGVAAPAAGLESGRLLRPVERMPDVAPADERPLIIDRRHHADDGLTLAVEPQRLPDDARVASESLPQPMTDDDDAMTCFAQLVRRERAPEQRRDAERGEVIGAGRDGHDMPRLGAGFEVAVVPGGARHLFKRRAALLPLDEGVRRSERRAPPLVDFAQPDDALRLAERGRGEKHGVDDREDGRVRADAQCERENDYSREARLLRQGLATALSSVRLLKLEVIERSARAHSP